MYFLLNLSHHVKSYGHFCQILAIFMMPTHQIWSCHVTQDADFENFLFVLVLYFILGKVTKFVVAKLSTSEAENLTGGGGCKHPPSTLGLNAMKKSKTLITSLSYVVLSSFLAGRFLETIGISLIFHCYGISVPMATRVKHY